MAESVTQLVVRARQGAFREVLPTLLGVATRDGGKPVDRWQAGAAAIPILFWQDEFTAAAKLAEDLITRDGLLGGDSRRGSTIAEQDYPFDMAILAADLHAGAPAGPQLERLRALAPAGSVLGKCFAWLAGELGVRPLPSLLPNDAPWGMPSSPLDGVIGADFLDDDYNTLPANRQRTLWNALRGTNQFEAAWDLYTRTGEVAPQWAVSVWLAGWCATLDRLDDGRRLLLAARAQWQPYTKWDCLPDDLVLHPVLRPLADADFREYFLTHPIGPDTKGK
jgi:hypothetical protein